MTSLTPVAIDLETTGLDADATLSVVGLAQPSLATLVLNAAEANADALLKHLEQKSQLRATVHVVESERAALERLRLVLDETLDPDDHYLTAFNGETWNGGFDLPYLRSKYAAHDVSWPDLEVAYADMLDVIDRFATDDVRDLVGVHERLVGRETCDPLADSEAAVEAYQAGRYGDVLLHNVADLQRTLDLAHLAERYVPKSDFKMKNLAPPART